jgi:hypothetical protein
MGRPGKASGFGKADAGIARIADAWAPAAATAAADDDG